MDEKSASEPFHRWAINEDPAAPSVHWTSLGRPDHCLTCGVVRYPLERWAQEIAAGPCPGRHNAGARVRVDNPNSGFHGRRGVVTSAKGYVRLDGDDQEYAFGPSEIVQVEQ